MSRKATDAVVRSEIPERDGGDEGVHWRLAATNGSAELLGRPQHDPEADASAEALSHRIELRYQVPGNLVDAWICCSEVSLDIATIRALSDELAAWLALPLDELRVTPFAHSAQLATHGSRLELLFAPSSEVITSAGGTACTIELQAGLLSARLVFAVDLTTLDGFAGGLVQILAASQSGRD